MATTTERRPATADRPPLELRRSTRRRRTIAASARDGVIVLQLPAGMPRDAEEQAIDRLVRRLTGEERASQVGGDRELTERANALADRYLDGRRPREVRWSSRMSQRFGSCTTLDGVIRISDRLRRFPDYVVDAVLVHELAHLHEAGHGRRFQELVARFPDHDRASGFLEGVQFAGAQPPD